MLYFRELELETQGIACKAATQFVYQGKLFIKGASFPAGFRDSAINFCQQQEATGQVCMLVEGENQLTVWQPQIEAKPAMPSPATATGSHLQARQADAHPQASLASAPTAFPASAPRQPQPRPLAEADQTAPVPATPLPEMPNGAGPVMPETPTQASPTESEDAVYTYRGRTYRMPKS
ncbi:MAG: hypothetical protein F6K19_07095, partial [Cyanothece sp. SIO1E1]|nr:hypothetical protein [Cyanothece sp. SIO1E1]